MGWGIQAYAVPRPKMQDPWFLVRAAGLEEMSRKEVLECLVRPEPLVCRMLAVRFRITIIPIVGRSKRFSFFGVLHTSKVCEKVEGESCYGGAGRFRSVRPGPD